MKKQKQLFFPILTLVLLVAVGLFLAILILYPSALPLDADVTVDSLAQVTESGNDYILAKVGDVYYETVPSGIFAGLFHFEDWDYLNETLDSVPVIALRFAEAWVLEIHADQTATVYNGYARTGTQSAASYQIPEGIAESVITWLEGNGIAHTLGDGTINKITFDH